jgi:LacI family transcriptional regulator
MKELARMAGVSRTTVDRVLNKRGRVNANTEDRIFDLARKMGYSPNLAAKSLSQKNKNYKIGCVINRGDNSFFDDVITGIQAATQELSAFSISTIITKTTKPICVQEQLDLLDELVKEEVNAIAINPLNDSAIAGKLNALIKKGIAVTAITADISDVDYLAFVGCNHEKAGRIAADFIGLITGGSANVAVIEGSPKMLGHVQRVGGFKRVIEEKYPGIKTACVLENGDDDIISYSLVSKLLDERTDIDVLFFVGAGTYGGIRAVEEKRRAEKIKIAAFDLTENNRKFLLRGLISFIICQGPYEQGYKAIKLLGDWLMSGARPASPHIHVPTELIISESLRP